MRATMMLADYASVSDGKLTLVGGGWCVVGPGPAPCGIGVMFEVPWSHTDTEHTFMLNLIDADGHAVSGPDGNSIGCHGSFTVSRPGDEHPEGADINVPFAVNFAPIPLPEGRTFEWRLFVDGETTDAWRATFWTRSSQ